jgi:hypothetical protein
MAKSTWTEALAAVKERAMGVDEQETVEVAGARTTVTTQLFGREADAMHALLIKRADELVGCTEGSPEDEELRALADVIEAYDAKRWPSGKVAGGKG